MQRGFAMKRKTHPVIIVLIVIATILILLAILFPIFGRAHEKVRYAHPEQRLAASPPPATSGDESPAGAAAGGGVAQTVSQARDRKIITTGYMTIEVEDLEQALRTLGQLVEKNDGFFSNRSVTTERNWRNAHVEIRVPADRFEALHQSAEGLGEVREDRQEGEDVTRQWQDLEARLKIQKTEERALLKLLAQQGSIQALLQVEKQLWDVREQIEQAEGELRYLRDRVTLATLTISLNEQVPSGVGKIGPWNLGWHLRSAALALVEIVHFLVIAIIYVALAGSVVWIPLLVVLLWRRKRRQV